MSTKLILVLLKTTTHGIKAISKCSNLINDELQYTYSNAGGVGRWGIGGGGYVSCHPHDRYRVSREEVKAVGSEDL